MPGSQKYPKQLVVRLPEDLYNDLKESATRSDRTIPQQARRAIRLYLEGVYD